MRNIVTAISIFAAGVVVGGALATIYHACVVVISEGRRTPIRQE